MLGTYGDYIQTHNSWGNECTNEILKYNDGRNLTFYNVLITKIRMARGEEHAKQRELEFEIEQIHKEKENLTIAIKIAEK